ncbi:MAG: YidC/Oxa1 family membrane protein insertase [Clostridia bacterium]
MIKPSGGDPDLFGRRLDILTNFFIGVLEFFYGIVSSIGFPNYGVAIILFTIAIKVLLFPLTIYQHNSMIKTQQVQPILAKLQKKYKASPERLNEEMQRLYKDYKVSPFASCLPLIIQLPIIWALFGAMRKFFSAENAAVIGKAGFLWISDLGKPDLFLSNLLGVPAFFTFVNILPILVAVATFAQQKILMKTTSVAGSASAESMQKTMLYVMPIFIGYSAAFFPAGLGIYWFAYSIVGTVDQILVRKLIKAPAPIDEEEFFKSSKEKKTTVKTIENQGTVETYNEPKRDKRKQEVQKHTPKKKNQPVYVPLQDETEVSFNPLEDKKEKK